MRAIDLKLLRDLWRLQAPLAAVILVMAAGVASMVMARSTNASLRRARAEYYDRQRFADVFVQVKRAPDSVAAALAEVPGVDAVETRVIHDVNLSVPGLPEPGVGRMISVPDGHEPALNAIHLRRGRWPEVDRAGEVLVNEAFAEANGLAPGDTFGAVLNGTWQRLTIVGIGLSPEFVYFVRPGQMLPDDRRTAVIWMPKSQLVEALDMEGAFNDVAFRLDPAASASDALRRIDQLLDQYGCLGAYDRTEHASDRYLTDEFNQLRIMGLLTPAIFLSVGAFLVNVVLGRLVRTQREQFATLKAFGYTSASLIRHVLLMSAVVTVAALVVGVVVGWTLGVDLTSFYTRVFRFPALYFAVDPTAILAAGLTCAGASAGGATAALRWIIRLAPAEAMRPESPRSHVPGAFIRWTGRFLSVRWRLVVRGVESHPWRSMFAMLGVAMSAAVLVLSSFALDAIDHMIDREYAASQLYNLNVVFNEPAGRSAMHSLAGVLGGQAVLRAEPFRAAAVRISSGHRSRRLALLGAEPDSMLFRFLDEIADPVTLPPEGLLLSENLADLLDVRPGDSVEVHFLEGRRVEARIPVAGVYTGYIGLGAAMNLDSLNRVMIESDQISGAYVLEDDLNAQALYEELKETPRVASVTRKQGVIEAFRQTIAQNMTRITMLHAIFASVICFGVVYNTARVALAERQRELATLRVLGFDRQEVSSMLLGEIGLLVALGVPVGLVIGRVLAWSLIQALETESYVFSLIISPATYTFAALTTVAAAALSSLIVRRGITRLDLLATLKNVG